MASYTMLYWCILTWRKILPNFIPIRFETMEPYAFFKTVTPRRRRTTTRLVIWNQFLIHHHENSNRSIFTWSAQLSVSCRQSLQYYCSISSQWEIAWCGRHPSAGDDTSAQPVPGCIASLSSPFLSPKTSVCTSCRWQRIFNCIQLFQWWSVQH